MKTLKYLLAVVLANNLLWAAPVFSQQNRPSLATSFEAIKLAEILVEANISEAAVDKSVTQMTTTMFEQQPDLMAFENTYPGMKLALLRAMKPIIDDEMDRIQPLYVADLALLLDANFSQIELQKLSVFWQSSAAQSVLKSAIQNVDYAAISAEVVDQMDEDGKLVISQTAVDQDMRGAVGKAMDDIGKDEQAAFLKFALSPEGRKFVNLKVEKKAVDLKWLNAPTPPDVEMRLEKSVMSALENHLRMYKKTLKTTG